MQANKIVELFQNMAIVSMNIGNLTLEVNNLKKKLAIGEKEKSILHEELNKDKTSRMVISIMWKFRGGTRQRLNRILKGSLQNYRMKMRSSRVAQHN